VGSTEEAFSKAAAQTHELAAEAVRRGEMMTCAMFRHEQLIFLYIEYIGNETFYQPQGEVFAPMHDVLMPWPGFYEDTDWTYMEPVFWFDVPKSVDHWRRKMKPDARCGRIARLQPNKLWGYVTHHLAIVEEGTFVGDRFQFISIHENLLFSYYETPRDRENTNVKGISAESVEIERWKAVDPRNHFIHFEEAGGADFLTIQTVFDVGITE